MSFKNTRTQIHVVRGELQSKQARCDPLNMARRLQAEYLSLSAAILLYTGGYSVSDDCKMQLAHRCFLPFLGFIYSNSSHRSDDEIKLKILKE
jgi:hypothetical protein